MPNPPVKAHHREEVTAQIQQARGVRRSTAEQYVSKLLRLATVMAVCSMVGPHYTEPNWKWLYKTDEIDEWLDDVENLCPRNGGDCVSEGTKGSYYRALIAACDTFLDDDDPYNPVDYYRELLGEVSRAQTEEAMNQRLRGLEEDRWPEPKLIEKNYKMLAVIFMNTDSKIWHFRHMLYMLYMSMRDVCVFRLDVLYNLQVVYGSQYDTDMKDTNYMVLDDASGFLAMNYYKTSATYGTMIIPLHLNFVKTMKNSLIKFPRKYFISCLRDSDVPMSQRWASKFVKGCWIVDDREKKPTADDIRSSLTTRFFVLNDSIRARDEFAKNSLSSRITMEMHYFKVNAMFKHSILSNEVLPLTKEDFTKIHNAYVSESKKGL